MKFKSIAGVAVVVLGMLFAFIRPAAGVTFEWSPLGRLAGDEGAQPFVSALATHPTDADILYAGAFLTTSEAALVYRSADGGQTWQPRTTGLPAGAPFEEEVPGVNDLLLLPDEPDTLYVGLEQGLWVSDDAGLNWVTAAGGSLGAADRIIALDVAYAAERTIYALTPDGVHVSVDGEAWVLRNSGLPAPDANQFNDLAVDPTSPSTVFVATNPSGVYRTNNSGQGWTAVNNNLPSGTRHARAVVVSPTTGDVFLSLRGSGLYRSTNNGGNWTLSHEGITYLTTLYGSVERPAFSPGDPDLAYVYNSDGAFRSEDGGETWTPAPEGFTGNVLVTALAFHEARPLAVYAGTSASGVWNRTTLVATYFMPVAMR